MNLIESPDENKSLYVHLKYLGFTRHGYPILVDEEYNIFHNNHWDDVFEDDIVIDIGYCCIFLARGIYYWEPNKTPYKTFFYSNKKLIYQKTTGHKCLDDRQIEIFKEIRANY